MNNIEQTIAINERLISREEEFMRIYRIERDIARMIGQEYPIPDPPDDLPSRMRPQKTAKKPAKTAKKESQKTIRLRSLQSDETAYRLIYRYDGAIREEIHLHTKTLQNLLNNQDASGLQFIQIDTVSRATAPTESDMEEWVTMETIWVKE
ncbi:MAG: hypothetical protein EOL87_00345 [Spartobacteria bacterium]|nr:hypothetical protein [Spartobacteria bacterium]